MIKFKKSEGSMKKAKIVSIFALIALAVAGIAGVKNTSAASTINPESGSKIAVRQEHPKALVAPLAIGLPKPTA